MIKKESCNLKNCPLCDGKAVLYTWGIIKGRNGIICDECGLSTPETTGLRELKKRWNTRVMDVERVKKYKKAV